MEPDVTLRTNGMFSLEALEFRDVLEFLAARTVTPMGRRAAWELLPSPDLEEVVRRQVLLRDCVHLAQQDQLPSLPCLSDSAPLLARLALPAAVLEAKELADLFALAAAARDLSVSLAGHGGQAAALAALAGQLPDLGGFRREAKRILSPEGGLRDHASRDLASLRRRLVELTERIQAKLSLHLENPGARGYLRDEFITRRNDRFVIPVRADSRVAVEGIVHGASASGATVFMEPLEIVGLNNDLVKLRAREAAEVQRLLESLTTTARRVQSDLECTAHLMGQIDLHQAAARMASEMNLKPAEISPEGRLELQGVWHLVLQERLRREDGGVVPCRIRLTPEEQVLVISGPNTGGKTVVLKTVGLAALMHQAGLPLPMQRGCLPVFRQVLADIGDHQSIALNLSTFSSHLLALTAMTRDVQAPALVLLDELGTGTDPEEGAALGMAVVDHFRMRRALVIVTTHHNGLKAYAGTTHGVRNASVEFNEETLQPTFRLLDGVAGDSSGIEIAARLGLAPEIVEKARRLVPEKGRLVESYMARLAAELARVQADRKAAGSILEEAGRRRRLAERRQREEEEAFRRRLDRLLEEMRCQFKADLATSLERLKGSMPRRRLMRGMEQAEATFGRLTRGRLKEVAPGRWEDGLGGGPPLKVGDVVSLKGLGSSGTVDRIEKDGRVTLSMRGKRLVVPLKDVRRAAPSTPEPGHRVVIQRLSLETSREVRLAGLRVEEALERLDKYLDQALLAGLEQVKVVHGVGSGRLRSGICSWLDRHRGVQEHRPGTVEEGGGGVTVVRLVV
ncbi:MAG: Smr/MutS family protein [Acidobacteriota bacterium]